MRTAETGTETRTTVEAWLAAARAGDNEALGRAMEACRQDLTLAADRELDPKFSAKVGASDIVQDTFLDAQRDFGRFSGRTESELKSWLRRIMLNNLVSSVRRYRRSKRQIGREVPLRQEADSSNGPGLAAKVETPSWYAIREEQALFVARGLERLPERQRQLIHWRHEDYFSFEEIGRRLAISPDAARMAWTRAIQRLREELGDLAREGAAGRKT